MSMRMYPCKILIFVYVHFSVTFVVIMFFYYYSISVLFLLSFTLEMLLKIFKEEKSN